MKITNNDVSQRYIDAAILHREASYNGDHKTANKQYKVLKKIYKHIEQNIVEKKLLLDLLKHDNVSVRNWAAPHMLGIKYEVSKAEQELGSIASMSNAGMTGFSAEMTLKLWKQQGFLKF